MLEAYCERENLGRSGENQAFVADESETIPDLVIRKLPLPPPEKWDDAPTPVLVVEILSDSTRRNDLVKKRAFYPESGIPEYWIVDGDARSVLVVTPAGARTETGILRWHPKSAEHALEAELPRLFREALG
jgi:Uma2 family endonuclease